MITVTELKPDLAGTSSSPRTSAWLWLVWPLLFVPRCFHRRRRLQKWTGTNHRVNVSSFVFGNWNICTEAEIFCRVTQDESSSKTSFFVQLKGASFSASTHWHIAADHVCRVLRFHLSWRFVKKFSGINQTHCLEAVGLVRNWQFPEIQFPGRNVMMAACWKLSGHTWGDGRSAKPKSDAASETYVQL